ncbi:thioesterase II family protein [Longispora albida]|uniref:thioesterase II family protein n=1 Tax=Longispora albida TaxID=203523 RepID=UPI000360C5A3|nr:alpha/beta fold hydrolase [Longispora albida]
MTPDPWLLTQRPRPAARLRVICLPFAGGGATAYRDWPAQLPDWAEVSTVCLPGRGARFAEEPHRSTATLIPALLGALRPREPYVLFGHSMGALTAFELCRALRAEGRPLPLGLVVSGRRAPHLRRPAHIPDLHSLPEPALLDRLRSYGGTPEELLANTELLELFLPALRADFELVETHQYTVAEPLGIPIVAYAGLDDASTPPGSAEAWGQHTSAGFRWELFPGGHFFLFDGLTVVKQLSGDLESFL